MAETARPGGADLTMMRVIHRAFRRDLDRLAELADRPETPAADLRAGWALVRDQLHLHHSSEDERLWPKVRERLGANAPELALLDEMERQHHGLEPLVEQVEAAVTPASVRALADALGAHLAGEEEQVVPVVERVLSADDLADFEDHQKRKLGVRGAAVFFPWLLDELPDDGVRAVLAQLPPPLRLLARGRWRRAYRRSHPLAAVPWAGRPTPNHTKASKENTTMSSGTKVAVIYYSATGTVHRLAEAVVAGAEKAGAEVRLLRVAELAPAEAIESNPAWAAHLKETADIPEATLDDLVWADAVVLGSATRFGLPASQMKQFIDRTGPLWAQNKLADKVYSSFTATSTQHGGQESAILALNNTFYHWGGFIVPPGYTDPIQFQTGNPYGVGHVTQNGEAPVGDTQLLAAEYLGRRVAETASALVANRPAA